MGSMAEYEYPDITIKQAIDIIQIVEDKSIQRLDVLADAIGHKGPSAYRGGGFRTKITALGRYGLLAGKPSELRLSDLAKQIVHPRSEEEKNEAIRRAVLSVPILSKIHEKLQGKIPTDFWVPLYDCTGVDQKVVKEHADNLRKLYADAVQYLQTTTETAPVKKEKPGEDQSVESLPRNMMQFRAGDMNVTLPFKPENVEILIGILQKIKDGADRESDT